MGTYESKESTNPNIEKINRHNFEFLYVIGKGGFGKVWRVNSKKNQKAYALKEMSKVKIIDRRSEKSINSERELLSKLHHPFIVNMIYAFQDHEHLYLVMDLLTGGDLRYHISRNKFFSEEQTKFFVGCLILGLEYIHGNKVIHRDIKPENLVCDEKGYIRITDFGVAKPYQKDNSTETSGTPGYMAPEVLCAQNHSYSVDFFAVGVLAFEFMMGVRPYLGKSRKEIKEVVMSKQVAIRKNDIPDGWSTEAADFINKLIQRKPSQRLGTNGINEIKDHPWLVGMNWKDLLEKKLESPFTPKPGDNFDKKYCESPDKIGSDTFERYQAYLKLDNFPRIFMNYTFSNVKEDPKKSLSVNANQSLMIPKRMNQSPSIGNNLIKSKLKIGDSIYINSARLGFGSNANAIHSNSNLNSIAQKSLTPDKYKLAIKNKTAFQSQTKALLGSQYNDIMSGAGLNVYLKGRVNERKDKTERERLPLLVENTKKSTNISSISSATCTVLNKNSSQGRIVKHNNTIKITGGNKISTVSSHSTAGTSSTNSVTRRSGSTLIINRARIKPFY